MTDVDPMTSPASAPVTDEPAGASGTGAVGSFPSPGRRLSEAVGRLSRRWSDDPGSLVEQGLSLIVVVAATALVLATLHPADLWRNTTPTGGDMGAHVWGPRYLLDHLLPHFRLSGWTPDWYDGFPAYQFYMVVPSLLVVLLHVGLPGWAAALAVVAAVVLALIPWFSERLFRWRYWVLGLAAAIVVLSVSVPYNRSFKLITAAGLLCLPAACWALAKLADLPFPIPPLASGASLLFIYNREPVFNQTGNIIGGNFLSTMAGEFAFSISLTVAVLYLGVAARGLRTGKHRALAAALFALAGLCHLIPAFFVLACTAALFLLHPDRKRLRWLATMVPVAGLLTAFWVVPFYLRSHYVNDMGWERLPTPYSESGDALKMAGNQGSVWYYLIPPGMRWLLVVALLGVVVSILRRYSVGLVLAFAWVSVMAAFSWMPQARLWNARLLPFMYLSVSLLAAIGLGEVIRLLAAAGSGRIDRPLRSISVTMSALAIGGVFLYSMLPLSGLFDGVFHRTTVTENGAAKTRSSWLWFSTTDSNPVGGWAAWNYSGLERKVANPPGCDQAGSATPCTTGGWPEYRNLVSTMAAIGKDPRYGCGRSFWEYDGDRLNGYGTPMAPMLFPYWTDGCIGSQEGLYFESSTTVPYHFLMQAELSAKPSEPQRELPYPSFDINAGVRHLQLLGVRYYLAATPTAVQAADNQPDLKPIAVSGPWHIYQVADTPTVAPLQYQPVVAQGMQESQLDWLPMASAWFLDPQALPVPMAVDGPAVWARIKVHPVPQDMRESVRWIRQNLGITGPMDKMPVLPRRKLPDNKVTNIHQGRDTISFDVSRPGVPVLVKTSYFPNWEAKGASGPYRVTPSLMVVVPTSTHVSLHYARTPVDIGAMAMTGVGLVLLVLLARARRVDVSPLNPGRVSRWLDDVISVHDSPKDDDALAEDASASEAVDARDGSDAPDAVVAPDEPEVPGPGSPEDELVIDVPDDSDSAPPGQES